MYGLLLVRSNEVFLPIAIWASSLDATAFDAASPSKLTLVAILFLELKKVLRSCASSR